MTSSEGIHGCPLDGILSGLAGQLFHILQVFDITSSEVLRRFKYEGKTAKPACMHALALYVLDLAIVLVLGRIAFKALPGEPTGLIMEMSEYRLPHLKTVLSETWFRLSEFVKIAFPLIILSSLVIKVMDILGFLEQISVVLSPVTVGWLGLDQRMGIALVFGVLRKELTLIMLAAVLGTTNFGAVLTSVQMVVFTIVVMLYVPCVGTIAALLREVGWKKTLFITVFETLFAVLVGGIIFRVLSLIRIP
jgi:ferrous iron transport protein B